MNSQEMTSKWQINPDKLFQGPKAMVMQTSLAVHIYTDDAFFFLFFSSILALPILGKGCQYLILVRWELQVCVNGPQYKCLSTSESDVPWCSITQLGRNLFLVLMDGGHVLPCNQFSCVPAHTTFCDIYFLFLALFKELSSLRRSGRASIPFF